MKTLSELFEQAKKTARRSFDARGEHIPVFLIQCPDGVIPVGAPWGGQAQKEIAILAVRNICRARSASRVVVITEGWMVVRPVGTNTDKLVPSKEADRKEVLWITAQSALPSEAEIAGFYDIVRDARGKAKVGRWHQKELSLGVSIFDGLVGGRVLQ
jgi:hypothetical protein